MTATGIDDSEDVLVESVKRGTFSVNLFAQVLSFIVSIGIGVLLTPYLIHELGASYYGLIPLAMTLISYCGILTVAINTSVSRSLIQSIEQRDSKQANLIFNTSIAVCSSIALVVTVALLLATVFVDKLVSIPEDGVVQARWLFSCTAISFVISTLVTPFSVSAFCRNRFEITHGIGITRNLVRVVLIVVLFWFLEPSIKSVGIAGLIAAFVEAFLIVVTWRYLMPEIHFHASNVQWNTFMELFSTGIWVSVFQVGTILLLGIDLLLVNHLFGAASGGRYAAVLQWSALLRNVAMTLAAVFSPTIIGLYGKGDLSGVESYAFRASRFVGYSMSIPIGILCGLAPCVLQVWLGPDFTDLAPLLVLLIAPLSINLAVMPLFSVSIAADKIKLPGLLTIGFGALNFLLAFVLATQTPLGIYGIALSGVTVLTLKNAIFTPAYAADNINRSWLTFITPLFRLLFATSLLVATAWVASQTIVIDSWFRIIGVSACLALVYSLALFSLVMDDDDRFFVSVKIHQLARRVGLGSHWSSPQQGTQRP